MLNRLELLKIERLVSWSSEAANMEFTQLFPFIYQSNFISTFTLSHLAHSPLRLADAQTESLTVGKGIATSTQY